MTVALSSAKSRRRRMLPDPRHQVQPDRVAQRMQVPPLDRHFGDDAAANRTTSTGPLPCLSGWHQPHPLQVGIGKAVRQVILAARRTASSAASLPAGHGPDRDRPAGAAGRLRSGPSGPPRRFRRRGRFRRPVPLSPVRAGCQKVDLGFTPHAHRSCHSPPPFRWCCSLWRFGVTLGPCRPHAVDDAVPPFLLRCRRSVALPASPPACPTPAAFWTSVASPSRTSSLCVGVERHPLLRPAAAYVHLLLIGRGQRGRRHRQHAPAARSALRAEDVST